MSDARRYAIWPEPRSRSRSLKGSRPSVPHGTNFSFLWLSVKIGRCIMTTFSLLPVKQNRTFALSFCTGAEQSEMKSARSFLYVKVQIFRATCSCGRVRRSPISTCIRSRAGREPESSISEPNQNPVFAKNRTEPNRTRK